MYTHKDIEMRTIFVVNCINHDRSLKVQTGELKLEELINDKKVTLTKFPFQKLLALFIVGHISVTTPLIEKCKRFGIALVVLKPNLRPVFCYSDLAEANFLLRQRQYSYKKEDITIAKYLVYSKIYNQRQVLLKTRKKDALTIKALEHCDAAINTIEDIFNYESLMGIEGLVSKYYFEAYFQDYNWEGRHPRVKDNYINVILDIGYTILFNYIECFIRMFGFDLYIGVYHRLWFKRKSLACDLMEPFRSIIDHTVRISINKKQFSENDFVLNKYEYHLKNDKVGDYYKVFFDSLIIYKLEIFKYIQQYYRCFMGNKLINQYPIFIFK